MGGLTMRLTIPGFLMAIALLGGASPLTAQWRAEPLVPVDRASSAALTPPVLQLPDSVQWRPPTSLLLMAGMSGAGVGALAGAFLGYHLDGSCNNRGCEDPGLTGALFGWFFGAAVGAPLSVHHANGGRGALSAALLSGALIAGAGWMAAGSPAGTFVVLGAPFAQVISAVVVEQRTAP